MFRVRIDQGKLVFAAPVIRRAFEQFKVGHEGAVLILTPEKHIRSNSQHRYYWLYLGVIERETGHDANELHELFKSKFLPSRSAELFGEAVQLTPTTTTLSKSEFSEYLDKICAFTEIPLPDPVAAGYLQSKRV